MYGIEYSLVYRTGRIAPSIDAFGDIVTVPDCGNVIRCAADKPLIVVIIGSTCFCKGIKSACLVA